MPDRDEIDSPLLEKKPERSGEYLWRVLKPAGCILVLVILVLYLIFCFTYKNDPLAEATAAPQQTEQTAETTK